MIKALMRIFICVLLHNSLFYAPLFGQTNANNKHILNTIRIIGHELLLDAGDSTSQVLPVTQQSNTYTLQFESEFQFNPEQLFTTIDSVVKLSQIAQQYIVEITTCATKEIIYSYEVGPATKADMIPCGTRVPDKSCYTVSITILETVPSTPLVSTAERTNTNFIGILGITLVGGLIAAIIRWRRKNKRKPSSTNHLVLIGEYQFDKIKSELIIQGKRIGFSAKESELLLLLHSAANETIEREKILKDIWGDEGDYIGRTLDVFISKLRKKLEVNTNLKIVNIRGVGYKLVVESE